MKVLIPEMVDRLSQISRILFQASSILLVLFFFLASSAEPEAAEAPDLSNSACLDCHGDSTLTKEVNGKEISVYVDIEKFKKSIHGENDCVSCHADITEIPHAEPLEKVQCAACHEDVADTYMESTHGKAYALKIPEAPGCVTCHGSHEILPKSDLASKTHVLHEVEMCTSCHINPKVAGKYRLPEADKIEAYRTGIHGRGLFKSGLVVSATCVTCHTAHNVRSKSDPESTIYWSRVPELCGSCHLGILEDFKESEHGVQWEKRSPLGPGCVSCHGAHGIMDPVVPQFQLAIPNLCGNCHKVQGPSYRDNFHGQVTALGYLPSATCADCHTPHKNLAQDDPRSTVHPANLQKTCGACHGQVSKAYITYDPHMDPRDPNQNKVVHYIWLFFIIMIYFVFGFFGLHYLLWFIRSLTGHLRGEFKHSADATSGPYIRRFTAPHIWVHMAVAVSFTVLAITGFTIYFHDMPAAQFVAKIFGGIGFMRYLHRVSAIITFGYAFYHVGYLVYLFFVKREKGLLWGPESMIPAWKDVADFFRNMRWFLFLGPEPKFDRWTYWEKMEYLVEWWGVPVIGISGLALWFPKLFTAFFPGWVLNAAQVVHTYEAFLATGYVFLFHFFVAHLRPECFPMDHVIFTGRMPLERFKQERPLEFERLVANGELENYYETAPTKKELRVSFIIGFVLVLAGLLLMIGIIRSVFFG